MAKALEQENFDGDDEPVVWHYGLMVALIFPFVQKSVQLAFNKCS